MRRLRIKAEAFFNSDIQSAADSKEGTGWNYSSGDGEKITDCAATRSADPMANQKGDAMDLGEGVVVSGAGNGAPAVTTAVALAAGLEGAAPSVSVPSPAGADDGAPAVSEAGLLMAVSTGAGGANGMASSSTALRGAEAGEMQKSLAQDKGKAKVGGPAGLALSVTPKATFGFAAAAAPPQLCRDGKNKTASSSRAFSKPIVINLEAAMRAVAGKLVVGRVLSPYPVEPKMVVNELRGRWHLRGDAVAQRVTSEDRRFVITFMEEGDRLHVLQASPWHFREDAVILTAFDGKGDPADVPLDSINIWAQIRGLPVPLKTVEMAYLLGDKLGKVVAVSHKNKMIVDEHLRVRVKLRVDEPLRKFIDTIETTTDGKTIETLFDVKYEKLPKFCLCCGMLGHTTATFCSIPSELRQPSYSTDIKVPAFWKRPQAAAGPERRHIQYGGRSGAMEGHENELQDLVQLPEKVVTVVSTAVQKMSVAATPPVQGEQVVDLVLGAGATQEGGLSLTVPSAGHGQDMDRGGHGLTSTLAGQEGQSKSDLLGTSVGTQQGLKGAGLCKINTLPADQALVFGAADGHREDLADGEGNEHVAVHVSQNHADEEVLMGSGGHPGAVARVDTKMDMAVGGGIQKLPAPSGSSNLARWRRLHREEQEERDIVQGACVRHVQFGVPTPPNSGSNMSSRKAAFADILESSVGNKRRCPDGQDMVLSFDSISSESREFRGTNVVLPTCKKVCGERVEALVGIDGNLIHVTKEVDGGEEEVQGVRRESVGEGKEEVVHAKVATDPGAVGQLTGACDDARQEP